MGGPLAGAPAFAGVDTHKETNTLGLIDCLGRPIGTWEFASDPAGYAALADKIADTSVPVGVEGARSYGAGLAAALAASPSTRSPGRAASSAAAARATP